MEFKKGMNSFIDDAIKNLNESAENSDDLDESRDISVDEFFNDKKAELSGYAKTSPQPDLVKWFSEVNNKDVQTVGGKGASLGEMYNSKFPVPPGFVITAQAFDFFITKSGIKDDIKKIMESIDLEDTGDLHEASKKIRSLIESKEIPEELEKEILESYNILSSEDIDEIGVSQDALNILKNSQEPVFVSVRSSATTEDLADASFAGQQESFLNVKGNSQLIEKVRKCFSSLYTPRAIYYRGSKGFKESEALLAVVVQKMIDSEKSGVVFSRDPVNLDDKVAIEAVFGLGEGIVGGKIKPDHYIVSRDLEIKDMKVFDKKIAIVRTGSGENGIVKLSPEKSKTQVLSRGELKEIADYAVRLEEHYKKPQDIEFAVENGEVYILQSRPITTLNKESKKSEIKGNVILQGQSASSGVGSGVVKIIESMDDLPKVKKGDVLVTEMTNPDMVVAMQKSSAIVTNEGGMTSHAAIVSREMGIPCVVGTDNATEVLKEGMRITVEGSSGKIFEGQVAESKSVEIKKAVSTEKIKIKVIVDLPEFSDRAAESGVEAIGLTRLEGIIASMKKHPLKYEKEKKLDDYTKVLEEGIAKIIKNFKSMWVRASDIRTDEYSSLEGAPEKEINPMLGFHGIRFSLKHPEILKAELQAIRNIADKFPEKKIGIMFPQVISIEEVKDVKKIFDEFRTENMEFGAMIETPASVQIIDDICKEVDFISFGTNDLTQFTLGVDRNNEDVQYLYNEMHPAIFSQIKKVLDACRENDVESSICGQAGSKKEMAEFLFKEGIKSISVNADAAHDISILISELEGNWKKGEDERLENERKVKEEEFEKERLEKERVEREEQERQERERIEKENIEGEERERQEKERLEAIERERLENEKKGEMEKFEEERKKFEKEKLAFDEEKKKFEEEKLEREKLKSEEIEKEEQENEVSEEEKLKALEKEKEESERLERKKEEAIEREKSESGESSGESVEEVSESFDSIKDLKKKLWKLKKQRKWKEFKELKKKLKKMDNWNKKAELTPMNVEGQKVEPVKKDVVVHNEVASKEVVEKRPGVEESVEPEVPRPDNSFNVEKNIHKVDDDKRIDKESEEIHQRVERENDAEVKAMDEGIEVSKEDYADVPIEERTKEIGGEESEKNEQEDSVDEKKVEENVGVYKPDLEEKKEKFNYNFSDWED